MTIHDNLHSYVLQKMQDIKKDINVKEFCAFHGITESSFSRFMSDKFIDKLVDIDYMCQFIGMSTKIYEFDEDK